MNYRWTMKELESTSDEQIILQCVRDRRSTLTNIYTPLYMRLTKIISKLDNKMNRLRCANITEGTANDSK